MLLVAGELEGARVGRRWLVDAASLQREAELRGYLRPVDEAVGETSEGVGSPALAALALERAKSQALAGEVARLAQLLAGLGYAQDASAQQVEASREREPGSP